MKIAFRRKIAKGFERQKQLQKNLNGSFKNGWTERSGMHPKKNNDNFNRLIVLSCAMQCEEESKEHKAKTKLHSRGTSCQFCDTDIFHHSIFCRFLAHLLFDLTPLFFILAFASLFSSFCRFLHQSAINFILSIDVSVRSFLPVTLIFRLSVSFSTARLPRFFLRNRLMFWKMHQI